MVVADDDVKELIEDIYSVKRKITVDRMRLL